MSSQRTVPLPPASFIRAGSERIAFRKVGTGPALVLLHGWPMSGHSWTPLLPYLTEHFTCYLPDTPGLGESGWNASTDLSLPGLGRIMKRFVEALGLESYSIMAYDTGGSVARELAARDRERVRGLVLLPTEIPFKHPPMVVALQKLMGLPGATSVFRALLKQKWYLRSSYGFGLCFYDRSFIDDAYIATHVQPLVDSPKRMEGAIRYALAIDWNDVDALADVHKRIAAPVLLVWGEKDKFFPVAQAREMVGQFHHCAGFVSVPRTRLLVHEERPDAVAEAAVPFLLKNAAATSSSGTSARA